MLHSPLVILDLEATGLHPEHGDRITEVGLVRIEGGEITDRFASLVNCDVEVPAHIAAYTGISQEMVDAAPPVSKVMREVAAFIGETAVVAHNASFDQRLFLRECRRARIGMLVEPFICSMRLSRRVYPYIRGHSLGELAYRLPLRTAGQAHRAAADAEVTAELMLRMGWDIASMHPGVKVTTQLLRELMHVPAAQLQEELERRCA